MLQEFKVRIYLFGFLLIFKFNGAITNYYKTKKKKNQFDCNVCVF